MSSTASNNRTCSSKSKWEFARLVRPFLPCPILQHQAETVLAERYRRDAHVAFYSVKVGGQEIKDASAVAPQGTLNWSLPAGAAGTVSWQAINDFGGITPAANKPL